MRPSDLPEYVRKTFNDVFRTMPHIVFVWRFETFKKIEITGNVMKIPWIQQISLFKHKNIRGFITHGGTLSMIEAQHLGIPTIGIPMCADHSRNIQRASEEGWALELSFHNISDDSVRWAINEIYTKKS